MSLNYKIKIFKIVPYYFLITILLYGLNIISFPGILRHLLNATLILIVSIYTYYLIKSQFSDSLTLKLIEIYIAYLLCSFILIPINGYTLSLIPKALIDGIFPIFFGIIGCRYANENIFNDKMLKYYYWGCIFMYICSIYLFIASPEWYINKRIEMLPDKWKNTIQIVGLLSGFSGTAYLVGYTSFFSFTYILFRIEKEGYSRWKLIQLLIIFFCMFFSQSRISLIWGAIVFLWFLSKKLSLKNFYYALILIIATTWASMQLIESNENMSLMSDIFFHKIENTTSDKRYTTGLLLLNNQTNYIFGSGYGSGGNYANSLGLSSVTDAEYFKLFYETGIIGFSIFLLIISNTYLRIFHHFSKFKFEFFIMSFYLSAMLIANPLSLDSLMAPVFWYCVGKTSLITVRSSSLHTNKNTCISTQSY